MKINLEKKPDAPSIILGFPGIGLIGPIVTEFLIDHMKTSRIGVFEYDELPPTVAIHKNAVVHPMGLHYSSAHNALILYTILNVRGQEWKIADEIVSLAKETNAKEIICIDGANTVGTEEEQLFAYNSEQMEKLGARKLSESVITGVTGALLLSELPVSCIFAATHSQMPDSKAAAEVVKLLDAYLELDVDHHPLLKQAEAFEEKLKSVIEQSKMTEQDQHRMDYLG